AVGHESRRRSGIMRAMSKHAFSRLALLCLFFALSGALSTPAARAEKIRSFDVTVRLQKDTTLDVTETIVWDFEGAERHGIFRNIPIRYNRYNAPYTIKVDVLSVDDGQ